MLRVLQRLDRSIGWHLLCPPHCLPMGMVPRPGPENGFWLARLRDARAETFGISEAGMRIDARAGDESAAHLLAVDTEGRVVGAVRLFLVDRGREALTARLLASFGRIKFPDPPTERHQLQALDAWLQANVVEPRFVYGGGFFTAPAWRASGLAAALGAAAVAWTRLHGNRRSVTFASVEGSVEKFFGLLSARPLPSPDGLPLDPFLVPGYDIRVRIVHFDTASPHPAIEAGVHLMQVRLQAMTALCADTAVPSANPIVERISP